MTWTNVAICDECWEIEQPGRDPYRLHGEIPEEACYRCGKRTTAGIYVRRSIPIRDDATEAKAIPEALTLHCLQDGTTDLLLYDAEGIELPQPYNHETMQAALVRISQAIDGYLRRMESEHCRCTEVFVGNQPTGSLNWNPDCPVHPWNDRLQAQSDRAVEWQRRAAEARKNARG